MCVLTTTLTAGGLAAIGASTAAASATAVAATTIAANALLGAGLSAGVGAATGARGRKLGMAALIGGASAGVLSGAGMALGGVTTVENVAGATVTHQSGGLLSSAATNVSGGNEIWKEVSTPAGKTLVADVVPEASAGGVSGTTGSSGIGLGISTPDLPTMGMMAANLGQGAFEGYAGMKESKENAKELEYQAKLNEIRAGQAQQSAEVEKMDLARKQRQLIGSGRAAAAANGVMLEGRAESSPAMFEQDAEAELAWDNAKIDYNANLESWGYMANAASQRRQAKSMRSMGRMKLASGLIKGAVGAAGSYFSGSARSAANSALYA